MAEIVILGAGLTGLSAAYHLEKQKFYDYKIFEKNSTSGGLLRSFKQDGFTFDFTGHFLHVSDNYFFDFLQKIADLKNFNLTSRNSAINFNNQLTDYPFQINLAGLPENVVFDSIYGFINIKKNIKSPKSFYEWVLKHFGPGMGKHFFFPYNSKILAYDLKKVRADQTGRFAPKTNLKLILKNALSKKTEENIGYNSKFYYPKLGGIQFLVDKLETQLKNKIELEHNAVNIDLATKTIYFENGHQEKFKTLITTLPLNTFLKNTTEKSNSTLKTAANKLVCNSVINFNLGFDAPKLKTKHWIYFPEKKYPFYRIGFWHNINSQSAPKNCSGIYGEASYQPETKTSKQVLNLTEKSINSALKTLDLKKTNIISQKILPIEHAYVIYDLWREQNLNLLHRQLNNLSVYSIGRYGEWKYSSMQEAVLDGKETVEQILHKLKNKKLSQNKKIIPAFKFQEIKKKVKISSQTV